MLIGRLFLKWMVGVYLVQDVFVQGKKEDHKSVGVQISYACT
jgi:hypothetical protein